MACQQTLVMGKGWKLTRVRSWTTWDRRYVKVTTNFQQLKAMGSTQQIASNLYWYFAFASCPESKPHKNIKNTTLPRVDDPDFGWPLVKHKMDAEIQYYYAALLPRRGPHIASNSVCLSVCPSLCPSVPLWSLPSVTSRHLANYNDTRGGPHNVRPSRPHKLVFFYKKNRFLGFGFLSFFLGFNLQMPDTKLRPTGNDSAMWMLQIAIHIWIGLSYVLSYISEKNLNI